MLDTIYNLRGTNTICVVSIGIAIKALELSALLPSQRMTEIRGRVALGIVDNRLTIVGSQQVLPSAVVSVGFSVLGFDVTVVVIRQRVYGDVVFLFGQQLPKRVIRVLIGAIDTIDYLGNTFFGIVLILNRSAVGKLNLLDKRGLRIGPPLIICFVRSVITPS